MHKTYTWDRQEKQSSEEQNRKKINKDGNDKILWELLFVVSFYAVSQAISFSHMEGFSV